MLLQSHHGEIKRATLDFYLAATRQRREFVAAAVNRE
jgi:hypothetical protein